MISCLGQSLFWLAEQVEHVSVSVSGACVLLVFMVFCYLLCVKIAELLHLATVCCHLPRAAGCNHGSGAESVFRPEGNARLMWSSLAGDFSSLFMTVSGKLIVFNSCERPEKPSPALSLCRVDVLLTRHRIFRKGALHSEKSHHSRWSVMDQTRLCGLETPSGKADVWNVCTGWFYRRCSIQVKCWDTG